MKRKHLSGQTFGRLLVTRLHDVVYTVSPSGTKQAKVYWDCICSCGKELVKPTQSIIHSKYPSCGCWNDEMRPERTRKASTKHGLCNTPEYNLYMGCKSRAKCNGLEFDLDMSDIVLPDVCSVLGIPIIRGVVRHTSNSPSIDRFDNSKGYTKENIRIISRRANCLKNDATLEELEKVVLYLKGVS